MADEGKEIVETVALPDYKDDVEEAQDDSDPVRLQLVNKLQQNSAM